MSDLVQHGAMECTTPPVDLDAVRLYRRERIRGECRNRDYAGVLIFDQVAARYATDATNMQVWCSHYEARCALVMTDGPTVLMDFADVPHLAEGLPTVDEYMKFPGYYYFGAGNTAEEKARGVGKLIADYVQRYGAGNKRLAVDRMAHLGIDAIRSHGIEIFDGQEVTEKAREIKSPGEIELMKKSIEVCEAGMDAMRAVLEPGITENALWSKLHETNIRLGGEWIETRLLTSGPRTNPWYRECSMREIEAGDIVSFDTDLIGPYGYCSDISRSWLCGDGKPDDHQRAIYAAAYEQLKHNIDMLKPGMSLREVSEKAWPIPDKYHARRYTCLMHGVGLADEYPTIRHLPDYASGGYDDILEENTTLCVEALIADEHHGEAIKLEEQVLLTRDGAVPLSTYPYEEEFL